MLNMRKHDTPKPAPHEAAGARSIYDRFPSPKGDAMPGSTPTYDHATPAASTPATRPDDGPTDFVIGRGTRLKGEIEAGADVIVEGEVEASIRAQTLRIAAGGCVTGQVNAANAEIRGRFEGDLHVRECLTVSGEGHVAGTVRYAELKVDRGARITGDIALVDDATPARPTVVASEAQDD